MSRDVIIEAGYGPTSGDKESVGEATVDHLVTFWDNVRTEGLGGWGGSIVVGLLGGHGDGG